MSGPHDLLVRYTFGEPERAAAELRAALPALVVSRVDWTSLKLERTSVVDPELRETETDLLFSARLKDGRQVLFYVLLEHQSQVYRWMALRLLSYVVRQLEEWRRQHPDSKLLPIILPVVLYHGPKGKWTAPRRVEELFDVPEEERELWWAVLPQFGYGLDDLTQEREEALRARTAPALVKLVLLVLVYGRSAELSQRMPGWMVDMLKSVMGEQRVKEYMGTFIGEYFEKGQAEGLAKGRAEGLAKARAEDVLRILAVRRVSVDRKARQRILSCTDLDTLGRWLDRAVTATHISDVLEDPKQ